jgi:hypothetical protein
MLKGEETYWICLNRDCGKTAACNETERGLESRVCDCGSLMKRETHAAVFSYLNFLSDEGSSKTEESKEKEETPCER